MLGMTGFLFSVNVEKKPGNGEDSFVYALNESRALVGVFDGGPGAGEIPALKGKSGGYLASRAAAAAYLHWFEALQPGQESDPEESIKPRLALPLFSNSDSLTRFPLPRSKIIDK